MKRLIAVLVSLFVLSASAAEFKAFSLLSVQYMEVTNTIGVTNLNLIGGVVTNVPGVIFTNLGVKSITVASTNSATNFASLNFFQDVPLWPDNFAPTVVSSNGVAAQSIIGQSGISIYVLLKGGTGANTATSFVVVPVFDGDQITGDKGFESNQAGDAFTFAVTPNTTSYVSIRTNLPTWNYRGVRALRVKSITAGDTDASSQVGIYRLEVVGFTP